MRACTESNSALFSYFFIMDVNKEKIRENEGLLTLVILCLKICMHFRETRPWKNVKYLQFLSFEHAQKLISRKI